MWTKPAQTNGILDKYTASCCFPSQYYCYAKVDTYETSAIVTGLSEGNTYECYVTARTKPVSGMTTIGNKLDTQSDKITVVLDAKPREFCT